MSQNNWIVAAVSVLFFVIFDSYLKTFLFDKFTESELIIIMIFLGVILLYYYDDYQKQKD